MSSSANIPSAAFALMSICTNSQYGVLSRDSESADRAIAASALIDLSKDSPYKAPSSMSDSADVANAASALMDMSSGNQYRVPSRVHCEHVLRLAESKIPGAGRGLFVLEDVKEGGLLFEIPNVLLSIVSRDCLETTCDYCLAHTSSHGNTDPRPDLSFTVCDSCKLLSYCSPACAEDAWIAYHKYECTNLAKIASAQPQPEGKIHVFSETFRALVRILSLQEAGKISNEEWEEIMGLTPQPPLPDGRFSMLDRIAGMKSLISTHEITKLSMEDVDKIIRVYFNNRCFTQLWTPVRSPPSNVHRYRNVDTPVGECLEPFFSMINHCCVPNSTWLSEGRTFQVRAERDIAAGEELSICYQWSMTFEERQNKLRSWVGDCTCALCMDPPKEPTGALRARVEKLITARGSAATPTGVRSISLLFGIEEMEHAGMGYEVWPMRNLYAQLFRCRCGQYDGPKMLKTWLKLYFIIEPAMQPQDCLANRNRSLTVLTYLLDLNDSSYVNLKPYPEQVVKLAPWLHYQLRALLLCHIRQCTGKDSYACKSEEAKYEKDFGQLERDAEAMVVKKERDYVPFFKSEESKWAFFKDMNELLAWAAIPTRTPSEILSIQSK